MQLMPLINSADEIANPSIDYKHKKILVADVDSTLAPSKFPLDKEMIGLMMQVLDHLKFAIISGAKWAQQETQIVAQFPKSDKLKNLYLFSTCATQLHAYEDNTWKEIYAETLSLEERSEIKDAFEKMYKEMNYKHPEAIYGEVIEDRGSQITFSAVGQKAPIEVKKAWGDADFKKRLAMVKVLQKYLPEYQITAGGRTSIDVTRKGIDKAYGIGKIQEYLHCTGEQMFFIGDSLMEGGGDYPVRTTGVECVQVKNEDEGKEFMKFLLRLLQSQK